MENTRIRISLIQENEEDKWDSYVLSHPLGTCYHLSAWRRAVEKTYGHRTFYIVAENKDARVSNIPDSPAKIVGLLPLIHIRHFLLGNCLVSLPFCDYGGILADDSDIEIRLLSRAIELSKELKTGTLELHQIKPVDLPLAGSDVPPGINPRALGNDEQDRCYKGLVNKTHKVRMSLSLPSSSEQLWSSFKAKLRSQIKKPMKEGLVAKIGGTEFLEDFYKVFSINMRDLGSPVHAKQFIEEVLLEFAGLAKLGVVYKGNSAMAGGLIIIFGNSVYIPWASSLREYNHLRPNMMLYWELLKYASDNGYARFDFGRSSPDGGTYKFKEQWGAVPSPIYWQYWLRDGGRAPGMDSTNSKFQWAIKLWQKLPVGLTKVIGPRIRKYIWL